MMSLVVSLYIVSSLCCEVCKSFCTHTAVKAVDIITKSRIPLVVGTTTHVLSSKLLYKCRATHVPYS